MIIQKNISLKEHNTWRVGGEAKHFAQPRNLDELREALAWRKEKNQRVFFLGSGSNVLVSDSGFDGLVVATEKMDHLYIEKLGANLNILAGSGVMKSEILKQSLKVKSRAALFLAGIPGTVGGGVAMNAGVGESLSPREFVEIVDFVRFCDLEGELHTKKNAELEWGYRFCRGFQPGVLVEVGLKIVADQDEKVPQMVRELNHARLAKQPLSLPSCGSVFRNPGGELKAAQMIEQAGLKGFTLGGAQVSTKHANFIVNLGTAAASDIQSCILHVQETVQKKFAVNLETEVVFLR